MKPTYYILLLLAVMALGCHKRSVKPTPGIAGTWRTETFSYDKNNDSVIAPDETFQCRDYYYEYFYFDTNRTGYSYFDKPRNNVPVTIHFTWYYDTAKQKLYLSYPTNYYCYEPQNIYFPDSWDVTWNINSLTDAGLYVTDSVNYPVVKTYYSRMDQ